MDRLRTPFLIIAIILSVLVVLIETGTALPGVLRTTTVPVTAFNDPNLQQAYSKLSPDQLNEANRLSSQDHPPGQGIPDLALIDSIVLFTLALMGTALVIPERLQGRVQGIATFIFSILLIIFSIRQIFIAVALLILMVSLLLSFPFGTITYLIIFGSFNRTGADVALSLILLFKFGFAASLIIAQQRFLQSRGLVLIILTSLVANVIVNLLLSIVPGFLDSITDAIAAIIVGILAGIWAIFLLIGAIIAIIKILRLDRALK